MKKIIALILAFVMVFALTACSSEEPATQAPTEAQTTEAPTTEAKTEAPATEAPTTEAPTTEAPTTEAPTTEAPTTEAPTTEAPTQSGTVDADKAAFYANYKENVGEFRFVGEDVRIVEAFGGVTMEMITAHDMIKIAVGDNFSAMFVDGQKLYVQTALPNDAGTGIEESWFVADIPAGEDPMEDFNNNSTEDYTYEEDMVMEYLETVEENGVKYDKVKVSSPAEDEDGEETMGDAIFWFQEKDLKVWKLEMEQYDAESDTTMTALMEFYTSDGKYPAPVDPQEMEYTEATTTFAIAMMSLLYGGM